MTPSPRLYHRREDVELREVGDDVFLVDQTDGRIHHLNATAGGVWRLLAEPVALSAMLAVFREAFPDMTKRKLKKALKDVLSRFGRAGLFRPEE